MKRSRNARERLAVAALVLAAACGGEGATEPGPRPPPPPPNHPPLAVGSVPGVTLTVGESATLDVAGFFADPDGDALRYAAETSNAGMASVSVSGSSVTIAGVARGTATVTVTAVDPEGLAAQQRFMVAVMNQGPVPVGALPALELAVGESAAVDLSGYFEDPEGDDLAFTAETSDPEVATARAVAGRLSVTAAGRGTAVVTVTARDPDGLSAEQTLDVSVANQAPVAAGHIAPLELATGAEAALDVTRYFADADGDTLWFSAATSNADVAVAAVDGDTLAIVAVGRGTAVVTVTAVDPEGLSARQTLVVSVINRAPVPAGEIPALELAFGESATLDASPYFTDPDGDSLSYAAATSNADMATVSATGAVLTIEGAGRGTATITVTASDPHGLAAQQVFTVTVSNRPPAAMDAIPDVTLMRLDVAVIDLSLYFTDPDGDTLWFSAATSNADVAVAAVDGDTLAVVAVGHGTAVVTVTAVDPEGLSARQTLVVSVLNRAPAPAGEIPALELAFGESATLDVSPYFTEPDGDTLSYSVATSNADMATVSATGAVLTIEGAGRGTATITVTATDPYGLAAQQVFTVTVPNRPPVATEPIPDVTLTTLDVAHVDLSLHFSDPDGDSLTYTAAVEDPAVASVVVDGSRLEVSPLASGETSVTVTAADPGGGRAEASFTVRVTRIVGGRFDIELQFQNALSEAHETAFRNAAAWWESTLAETELSDIPLPRGQFTCSDVPRLPEARTIDDLVIAVSVTEIDGPSGTVGRAGPCLVRNSSGLPLFGRMRFDVADFDRLEQTGDLFEVVLHEIAHVLGLGTLWERHGLLRNPSTATLSRDTHFAGRSAIEAFDEAGGTGYTGGAKVPVENSTGRSGSDNGHWRNSVFGNELLTAFQKIGIREPASAITIRSLADLGYTVNLDLAEPYRLPLAGARAAPDPDRVIFLGDDILREPIRVVDSEGRTVRVIGGER